MPCHLTNCTEPKCPDCPELLGHPFKIDPRLPPAILVGADRAICPTDQHERVRFEAALKSLMPASESVPFSRDPKSGKYRAEYVERCWRLWQEAIRR